MGLRRFLKRDGEWWVTESNKSRASMPKRSREKLLASLPRFWPRHSNSNRNEARAAAESGFEEEYLSSIKRRKLLRHLNRQSKRNS